MTSVGEGFLLRCAAVVLIFSFGLALGDFLVPHSAPAKNLRGVSFYTAAVLVLALGSRSRHSLIESV